MKSYASIDRIEGDFAVCEVENIDITESKNIDYSEKETLMIDIPMDKIYSTLGKQINEGDIIVVKHNDDIITEICYQDEVEKARRTEYIKSLMQL